VVLVILKGATVTNRGSFAMLRMTRGEEQAAILVILN
jgi:hypothetical protein